MRRPVFADQPAAALDAAEAGLQELLAVSALLLRRERSVLGELCGGAPIAADARHWPLHDAHDRQRGYRWYFHRHAGGGSQRGEAGHFHLFADAADVAGAADAVTHLVAVTMDAHGRPIGLVAPNRWVSDEHWLPAPCVLAHCENFALERPRRWQRVHRWLAAVLRSFGPQVQQLLHERDARVAQLLERGHRDPLEDRRIAVLSRCPINLLAQAEALEHARSLSPSRRTA